MKFNVLRALGTVLLLTCSFAAAAELKVIDPWVRSAPPNAPALGVFMTLENHSSADQSVVAVRTSLAVDRVELHRTMMMGDVMKMMPQQQIPVASHSA
ncbi:MAG: copper chaperone PCu(A)C, partial [Gammaproteobacteria bacterium]|nr:copper chaperone PCu(A)C [Gammaproteobacteria bacterium]